MPEFSFGSIALVSFAVAYLESVADIKGGRGGKVPPRSHRVDKFSVKVVEQRLNARLFKKKITFLLEPQFLYTPFLIGNTYNLQIFPSIRQIHVFLLKMLGKFSPFAPFDIFEQLPLLGINLNLFQYYDVAQKSLH